jgi:O-antigen/teichoic acid export membrane protein
MTGSTRIIVNTIASYARLCVLALVGILATPIILHVLGPTDYGIFSVIGGSLAFLMFINGALTTGAQRHIAFSLGQGKADQVSKWFTASLLVHLALGTLIAVIAVGASHWILYDVLSLPHARLAAAVWIYYMVVAAMVCNIVSTPFQATMMAHESIVVLSAINILSALTTIGGAFILRYLHGDLLIWYSALYCLSQIILFVGPILYALYRYPECRRISSEGRRRQNILELLGFSGWNLFGALAAVIRSQGPAIIINQFYGAGVNAAYGLAIQANGFSSEISWGVLRATTSPIVKRHASGDAKGMASLSNLANKFAFIVLWLVVAPIIFEVGFCLKLWLKHVPPHTQGFVSLMLIALLIDQLTSGFGASLQATGRIAAYQIVVGSMNCLGVPIGYVLLREGMRPEAVLWGSLAGAAMAACSRLWFAKVVARISVRTWSREVLLPALLCAGISSAGMVLIMSRLPEGALRFSLVAATNILIVSGLMWKFGLSEDHRGKLRTSLLSRFA